MKRTTLFLVALALTSGCDDGPATTETSPGPHAAVTSAEAQGLAAARAATARFHRFDVADEAGYDFLFMDMCMVDGSSADLGGMGYHYVNTGLLDASLDITRP